MTSNTRDFGVTLLDWKEIHEIPDGWPATRLLALLESLEVDGIAEADASEMTLMALQDLEVDEAAERVLAIEFGDRMRAGVRQNLAHDLTGHRPWEEHADIFQQAGIFNAVVLLQKAFPRDFDKPDAVSVIVRIETESGKARSWLEAARPDRGLLLRILAAPMEERAVLRRLFHEALRGPRFPEADGIVWQATRRTDAPAPYEFELISSHQWFDALEDHRDWPAKAWPDVEPEPPHAAEEPSTPPPAPS